MPDDEKRPDGHVVRPQSRRRMLAVACVLTSAAWIASDAAAVIYKWKDEQGKLHFAQSLNQVPARYREQADTNARKKDSGRARIQTYSPAQPSAARESAGPASRSAGTSGGRTFRIPVQRAGTSLRVIVRLNNRLDVPFLIDTGASDVAVPRKWIEELGVDLENARTGRYSTANGIIEVPKIRLDSVALGGARVRNVPASVSDSMSFGLLGLSFFNHFNYHVDPARGIVTLVDNGMANEGLIRGGRSEAQWRSEFGQIEHRREAIEREIETTPASHGREHRRLEAVIDELERQLEVLEDEADEARVPFGWRN